MLLGFHRLLFAALLTVASVAPAHAGAISASITVGVTVVQSSGVCGATSGTSTITVTCVPPGPTPVDPGGVGTVGGGTPVVSPPSPVNPGTDTGAGTGTGGTGGNDGAGGVAQPSPDPTTPNPGTTPETPTGVVPPTGSSGGSTTANALAAPSVPGITRFSAAASLSEAQALSETMRRVFLLPTLVPGAAPILVYSSRAEISGSRNVSHDNGSYLELTIAW